MDLERIDLELLVRLITHISLRMEVCSKYVRLSKFNEMNKINYFFKCCCTRKVAEVGAE